MSFIYMLQCYSFKKLKDLTNDNLLGYKSRKTPWTKKKPYTFWPVYNCNKLWRLPLGNKTIKNSHEFLPYVFISFILFTVHKRNMFCDEIFWNISLKVKCECKDNQNLSTLHNSREISRYNIYKLKAARTYK